MTELDIKLIAIFLTFFIIQITTLVKIFASQKYLEKRLDSIDRRLDRQNNRLDKFEESQQKHITTFHSNVKKS